jgi:sulfur-oxidizing protein SoxY
MDTGFVDSIPAYNLETMTVTDARGTALGKMTINGSVSEDPAFTLILPGDARPPFAIHMADSNGRLFDGMLHPQEPAQ